MAVKRPVRDALRKKLLDAAVAKGADPAKTAKVLAEMEGTRPLIDWLARGGFAELLKLVLQLVAVLA